MTYNYNWYYGLHFCKHQHLCSEPCRMMEHTSHLPCRHPTSSQETNKSAKLGKGEERCRSLGRGWECIISQSPFPSSLAFYFDLALILHKRSVWLVAIWKKKKKRKKTEGKKEMPHGVISGVVLSSEAHRYNYMIQEWDKLRKVTHYV